MRRYIKILILIFILIMDTKNIRKVQCNNKGQWTITIPKAMVGILKIEKGAAIEFVIIGDVSDPEIRLKRSV